MRAEAMRTKASHEPLSVAAHRGTMQQTGNAARPDPHQRLERLKTTALAVTAAVAASVWWLVAGHQVGSVAAGEQPAQPATTVAPRHQHDDSFFANGGGLSSAVNQQPVMRTHGS